MIPEYPNEAHVSGLLAGVVLEAMGIRMRLCAARDAKAGFVVWDARPPQGENWSQHRYTMLEAIYTGLAFCQTHMQNEWCILGSTVLLLLRCLRDFDQCEPVDCYPLLYVGKVKTVSVYIPASGAVLVREPEGSRALRLGSEEFYVGVDDRCSRGLIQNHPVSGSTCYVVW